MDPRSPILPAIFAGLAFIALAVGLGTLAAKQGGQASTSAAGDELPKDLPDMRAVFAEGPPSKARADAIAAAKICADLADVLQFDATLDKPGIVTEAQLEDIRVLTATYKRHGVSFVADYPRFIDEVNGFLTIRLNDGQDALAVRPLTPKLRDRWVAAYDDLRKACNLAAKGL